MIPPSANKRRRILYGFWYDSENDLYCTEVGSDSSPYTSYQVDYDPFTDKFGCACPGFRFNNRCKHIARVKDQLLDYYESSRVEHEQLIRALDAAKNGPATFNVSLNNNESKSLDRDLLDWLLDSLNDGDEALIRKG